MTMTLDEAIVQAKEIARNNREYIERNKGLKHITYYDESCEKRAEEHEQLAALLEELKDSREKLNRIKEIVNADKYSGQEFGASYSELSNDIDNIRELLGE